MSAIFFLHMSNVLLLLSTICMICELKMNFYFAINDRESYYNSMIAVHFMK